MSSILDALNKLEEEKKEAARTAAEAVIDPRVAARELFGLGKGALRGGHAGPSPVLWGLAGMGALAVLAAVVMMFVVSFGRPGPIATIASAIPAHQMSAVPVAVPAPAEAAAPVPAVTLAAVAPNLQPEPAAAVPEPVAEPPKTPQPREEAPAPRVEARAPAPATPAPAPVALAPLPTAPPAPAMPGPATLPEPTPPATPAMEMASTKLPELAAVGQAAIAPAAPEIDGGGLWSSVPSVEIAPLPPMRAEAAEDSPLPAVSPAAKRPAVSVSDLKKLPPLRETDRVRLGFDKVKINMVQPVTEKQPHARAIINYKPIMIGEIIPQTRTKLIGVDTNGIAIEATASGERYFVQFGYSLR
jgi:hypothetical protein